MLNRGDPAYRKTAAITGAIDVINNRRLDIARAQEIGVQRVHGAVGFDCLLGSGKRLPEHLAAKYIAGADVATGASKQVVFQSLKRQQIQQFGYNGLHS